MKLTDYREGLLERLRDPEYAAGYLATVLDEESPTAFLIALRDVVDARRENLSALADRADVTRQTLYQVFSKDGNPRFSTITQLLKSLGLQLSVDVGR